MYHVDIILLWILQRCKMEYNCIYHHSIKGAWFIKTHKSSIILIMGLIKIRDIKNISAVLRCSPISCPDKDSLLIRDEVLLQEIANLVWNHYSSSNVEPFTQLILKPMECGSTLWNQTKLWQQLVLQCGTKPKFRYRLVPQCGTKTDSFHIVEPNKTVETNWFCNVEQNHNVITDWFQIVEPNKPNWLSGSGKWFHNVEPVCP